MEKVIFPFNAELKEEIDQIRHAIEAEQNIVVATSMGSTAYKKNYGVPLSSLRKIATAHRPDKKLAQCLWATGYRETMILALLIMPPGGFTQQEAQQWAAEMPEYELAEIAAQHLYKQLPFATQLATQLSGKVTGQQTEMAYLTMARLLEEKMQDSMCLDMLAGRAPQDVLCGRASTVSAVATFLKQLGLYSSWRGRIDRLAADFAAKQNMQARWAAEEIKTFVEYMPQKEV